MGALGKANDDRRDHAAAMHASRPSIKSSEMSDHCLDISLNFIEGRRPHLGGHIERLEAGRLKALRIICAGM